MGVCVCVCVCVCGCVPCAMCVGVCKNRLIMAVQIIMLYLTLMGPL